jgi:membrane protein implicated in regulation of membrane protease activity
MIDGLGAFYLVCFGCGLVMVLLSVLSGVGHTSLHVGHIHAHFPAHGHSSSHVVGGQGGHGGADGVSPFNAMGVLVFLTWFGGAGYVLHGPLGAWGWLSLAGAALAGLLAAALVFQFLARILAPQSKPLDPADYVLEGQVGTVSSPIRPGGVGEVQYVQRGRRRSIGARAAGSGALERGTEVVIVRVERGLADVAPWAEFVAAREGPRYGSIDQDQPANSAPAPTVKEERQ